MPSRSFFRTLARQRIIPIARIGWGAGGGRDLAARFANGSAQVGESSQSQKSLLAKQYLFRSRNRVCSSVL